MTDACKEGGGFKPPYVTGRIISISLALQIERMG